MARGDYAFESLSDVGEAFKAQPFTEFLKRLFQSSRGAQAETAAGLARIPSRESIASWRVDQPTERDLIRTMAEMRPLPAEAEAPGMTAEPMPRGLEWARRQPSVMASVAARPAANVMAPPRAPGSPAAAPRREISPPPIGSDWFTPRQGPVDPRIWVDPLTGVPSRSPDLFGALLRLLSRFSSGMRIPPTPGMEQETGGPRGRSDWPSMPPLLPPGAFEGRE